MPGLPSARSGALAAFTVAAALAAPAGAAPGPPPGPTDCGEGLTRSDADPQGRLPARGDYRTGENRLRLLVRYPTQVTRVTLRAHLLGGRRIDAAPASQYSCTRPGLQSPVSVPMKASIVRRLLRRTGRVRARVRMQMVNGNGRTTIVERVMVVRAQRAVYPVLR